MPLEDEGGDGVTGSHLEAYQFFNDVMSYGASD